MRDRDEGDAWCESPALIDHVTWRLQEGAKGRRFYPKGTAREKTASSVLFLLGRCSGKRAREEEPCVVFNKRSAKVRQPGDLCFPGGRILPGLDIKLSRIVKLPFLPLGNWPLWPQWSRTRQEESRELAVLFAAGLRESLEEMRLNPLGVKFLGPMPVQSLSMFRRDIYPMVVWIARQRRFLPNWEVERVVPIPLKELLNPQGYACYRIRFESAGNGNGAKEDFPCFVHEGEDGREVLWGATYEIVLSFLELVFAFKPPETGFLPIIRGTRDETYLRGAIVNVGRFRNGSGKSEFSQTSDPERRKGIMEGSDG